VADGIADGTADDGMAAFRPGTRLARDTVFSITPYSSDRAGLTRPESAGEAISRASQAIEPAINTVVRGTRTRPVTIPTGLRIPKQ
jgi:hypothetical protein